MSTLCKRRFFMWFYVLWLQSSCQKNSKSKNQPNSVLEMDFQVNQFSHFCSSCKVKLAILSIMRPHITDFRVCINCLTHDIQQFDLRYMKKIHEILQN